MTGQPGGLRTCTVRPMAAIAAIALGLCSCQSISYVDPNQPASGQVPPTPLQAAPPPGSAGLPPAPVPPSAEAIAAGAIPPALPPAACCPQPLPIPYDVKSTACYGDELLCDGGDHHLPVMVAPDWKIYGLEMRDTVAHFDTIDGRTLVQPSNCACVYAPRFGAVRSIARIGASEQIELAGGMMMPAAPANQQELAIPASSLQREQLQAEATRLLPEDFITQQNLVPVSSVLRPVGFQDQFLPYENLRVIRRGILESDEKARLARAVEAAIVWTENEALQVTIMGLKGEPLIGDQRAQVTYTVKDLRNHPCLRVIKVASTQTARSGDTVDFTIRMDNLGDQPLGNIVLLDHLTTRLEYVPGSAQSSVETRFTSTPAGDGKSIVLRWEVAEPIVPGQGGLVRFRCRVL